MMIQPCGGMVQIGSIYELENALDGYWLSHHWVDPSSSFGPI